MQYPETILIPTKIGKLEIAISHPKNDRSQEIAIICHPHPVFGGTMENKVVTSLARLFREHGITAIRFNFRGVGQSTGSYSEGIGETDDLRYVIHWANQHYPNTQLYLAGFSFGSYIAAKVAHEQSIKHLISIAPPVNHFDFNHILSPGAPWLIVQGTHDDVVPAEEVFTFTKTLSFPHKLITLENAGHFFHGRLLELRDRITEVLFSDIAT